jgi:hypothetical protein
MDCNPWADTHLRLRKARLDATLWMPDPAGGWSRPPMPLTLADKMSTEPVQSGRGESSFISFQTAAELRYGR